MLITLPAATHLGAGLCCLLSRRGCHRRVLSGLQLALHIHTVHRSPKACGVWPQVPLWAHLVVVCYGDVTPAVCHGSWLCLCWGLGRLGAACCGAGCAVRTVDASSVRRAWQRVACNGVLLAEQRLEPLVAAFRGLDFGECFAFLAPTKSASAHCINGSSLHQRLDPVTPAWAQHSQQPQKWTPAAILSQPSEFWIYTPVPACVRGCGHRRCTASGQRNFLLPSWRRRGMRMRRRLLPGTSRSRFACWLLLYFCPTRYLIPKHRLQLPGGPAPAALVWETGQGDAVEVEDGLVEEAEPPSDTAVAVDLLRRQMEVCLPSKRRFMHR